jgi:hypothetical protein
MNLTSWTDKGYDFNSYLRKIVSGIYPYPYIEDLPDFFGLLKDCIKAEFVLFEGNGCLQEKPLFMEIGYTRLINAARKFDGVRVFSTALLRQNEFMYGQFGLI